MRFLKWIALISGILAGVACFILAKEKKEREGQKLDEYLMGDGESDQPMEADVSQKRLASDILSWRTLPTNRGPVTISFGFASREDASHFQSLCAADGYSSDLDSANCVVDILYSGEYNSLALSELASSLESAMAECSGTYQGFHFDL